MGTSEQSYGTGVFFVFLATMGWSLSGVFVRIMPGLDGWQLNCWRGYWMAVALMVYLVAVYGRGAFQKFLDIPRVALFASALFFALGSTLYVSSLTMVSTATVSVIGATSPLFAALLSPWVTGEKPGFEAWIAAMLALFGVGVIAWDGLEAGRSTLGLLLSICVPMAFAGQTLALRRYRNVDMVPSICLGGIMSFFIAGFLGFTAGHAGGGFDVGLREVLAAGGHGHTSARHSPGFLYQGGPFGSRRDAHAHRHAGCSHQSDVAMDFCGRETGRGRLHRAAALLWAPS